MLSALILTVTLQTPATTEYNTWRLDNMERVLEGVQQVLTGMREEEAVEHEMRLGDIEADIQQMQNDIGDLEDSMKWLTRALIGAGLLGGGGGAIVARKLSKSGGA